MILIVDGSGLACALWWANALEVPMRFANIVGSIALTHNAGRSVICWDAPGPTWRHEIMPAYKQGRPAKPDGLRAALRDCRRAGDLELEGYEADDIIGTLASRAIAAGERVMILSQDKDFAQLIGPLCVMVNARGELTDAAAVEMRWGVPPSHMRLLLSWMGDSSDGLPGVAGIGPKKGIAHALAGEMGDPMTYELVGLATVPAELLTDSPRRTPARSLAG